jgi:hypothetical protein
VGVGGGGGVEDGGEGVVVGVGDEGGVEGGAEGERIGVTDGGRIGGAEGGRIGGAEGGRIGGADGGRIGSRTGGNPLRAVGRGNDGSIQPVGTGGALNFPQSNQPQPSPPSWSLSPGGLSSSRLSRLGGLRPPW